MVGSAPSVPNQARTGQPTRSSSGSDLYQTGTYLIDLCVDDRLKAKTADMKRYISKLNEARGKAFDDHVVDLLRAKPSLVVKPRVEKIGSLRVEDKHETLGDIDVLVADRRDRRLIAIECKNLAPARTPGEVANELARLQKTRPGAKSTVELHLARTVWMHRHADDVVNG